MITGYVTVHTSAHVTKYSYCYYGLLHVYWAAGIAWEAQRLARGWMVRGSNSGGDEIFWTPPDRPRGPPRILYNGYQISFPRIKRPGVALTTQPLLPPSLSMGMAILPPPLSGCLECYGTELAVIFIFFNLYVGWFFNIIISARLHILYFRPTKNIYQICEWVTNGFITVFITVLPKLVC